MPTTGVTQILEQIETGDPAATEQLLPLVYEELRKLAAAKLAHEKPGQTLQATALVHEVYIRLVDVEKAQHWDSRGHFFAAAAEAMRRILVEIARRKKRIKHGGEFERVELDGEQLAVELPVDELLAVDEALEKLEESDGQAARLLKLHYFAGLSVEQAAELLGIPTRTAYRNWAYARAWMYRRVGVDQTPSADGSK
jgi:RNA polymerase sigma factor (TIGR02999 family)